MGWRRPKRVPVVSPSRVKGTGNRGSRFYQLGRKKTKATDVCLCVRLLCPVDVPCVRSFFRPFDTLFSNRNPSKRTGVHIPAQGGVERGLTWSAGDELTKSRRLSAVGGTPALHRQTANVATAQPRTPCAQNPANHQYQRAPTTTQRWESRPREQPKKLACPAAPKPAGREPPRQRKEQQLKTHVTTPELNSRANQKNSDPLRRLS